MNNADLGTSTGEVDPQLMRSIIRLCSMEPCSKRGVLLCQWKNAGGVLHHTGNYSDQNAFLQVQTFIYLGGGGHLFCLPRSARKYSTKLQQLFIGCIQEVSDRGIGRTFENRRIWLEKLAQSSEANLS